VNRSSPGSIKQLFNRKFSHGNEGSSPNRVIKIQRRYSTLASLHTPSTRNQFHSSKEHKQRRRRRQRKQEKSNRMRLAKQQLCTCIMLFCTFLCRPCTTKGDVSRDDSQRRFSVQHSLAMLEQRCNHSKQYSHNVATLFCAKNRRFRIDSCNITLRRESA